MNSKSRPLLGMQSCIDLGLVLLTFSVENKDLDRDTVFTEYGDLFKGTGVMS